MKRKEDIRSCDNALAFPFPFSASIRLIRLIRGFCLSLASIRVHQSHPRFFLPPCTSGDECGSVRPAGDRKVSGLDWSGRLPDGSPLNYGSGAIRVTMQTYEAGRRGLKRPGNGLFEFEDALDFGGAVFGAARQNVDVRQGVARWGESV